MPDPVNRLKGQKHVWLCINQTWTRVKCRVPRLHPNAVDVLIPGYGWERLANQTVRTDEEHAQLCLTR